MREVRPGRIDVRRRHALERTVGLQHVDRAPVGEVRHGQPGDAIQRRLRVGHAGQLGAGLGQEAQVVLGVLAARHVQADAGHGQRMAVVAAAHHPSALDPVHAAVGPHHAVLDPVPAGGAERLLGLGPHARAVVRMHQLQVALGVRRRGAWRQAVPVLHARPPRAATRSDVGLPDAHPAGLDRQLQPLPALAQRFRQFRGGVRRRQRRRWMGGWQVVGEGHGGPCRSRLAGFRDTRVCHQPIRPHFWPIFARSVRPVENAPCVKLGCYRIPSCPSSAGA
jgi:hypothetical protein